MRSRGRFPFGLAVSRTFAVVSTALAIRFATMRGSGVALAVLPETAPAGPVIASDEKRRSDSAVPVPTAEASLATTDVPSTLQGTAPDGALRCADGHLIVTSDTKRFFDYYLLTTGEEPEAAVRARTEAAVRARLVGVAREEAEELYRRYASYRAAANQVRTERTDIAGQIGTLRALRRNVVGQRDAPPFFAREEALEDEWLKGRVASTMQRSPMDESHSGGAIARAERERNARSVDERRREREDAYGRRAAQRLESLDAEEAAWLRRVELFMSARLELRQDRSLDEAVRERRIEALRERQFARDEVVRLKALERIAEGRGAVVLSADPPGSP